MLKGFKQFILRGNVIDLAVAVLIGASFSGVVTAFTTGILTPLIGLVGGQPNFSSIVFQVGKSTFFVGNFINAIVSFFITAFVIYFFVIMPMNKLQSMRKKDGPQTLTTKHCPFCDSEISLKATKCPACTSLLSEKKK